MDNVEVRGSCGGGEGILKKYFLFQEFIRNSTSFCWSGEWGIPPIYYCGMKTTHWILHRGNVAHLQDAMVRLAMCRQAGGWKSTIPLRGWRCNDYHISDAYDNGTSWPHFFWFVLEKEAWVSGRYYNNLQYLGSFLDWLGDTSLAVGERKLMKKMAEDKSDMALDLHLLYKSYCLRTDGRMAKSIITSRASSIRIPMTRHFDLHWGMQSLFLTGSFFVSRELFYHEMFLNILVLTKICSTGQM